ncbi:MAG TPA: hypothetical protein V6D17_11760 [Candidatus Obscuribacterales bacterium]
MIAASIKMGWQDWRLLLPSILTVVSNFFFAILLFVQTNAKMGGKVSAAAGQLSQSGQELFRNGQAGQMVGLTALNGPMDPSGFGNMVGTGTDIGLVAGLIVAVWWLTNRFLEGVTTALVYSHLTEGSGSGRFSIACQAVLSSLPALVILGLVTLVAKTIARGLRNHRGTGVLGFGVDFLAGIVTVFWTLAGHLILPSIVIEGTSFWGAMKRADRMASGNLLTIGVGEVGVDVICRLVTALVWAGGVAGFAGAFFLQLQTSPLMFLLGLTWACLVVVVTAMSIYIRSAFYTCLYVWAIEAEAVEETERANIKAPAPLAAALA